MSRCRQFPSRLSCRTEHKKLTAGFCLRFCVQCGPQFLTPREMTGCLIPRSLITSCVRLEIPSLPALPGFSGTTNPLSACPSAPASGLIIPDRAAGFPVVWYAFLVYMSPPPAQPLGVPTSLIQRISLPRKSRRVGPAPSFSRGRQLRAFPGRRIRTRSHPRARPHDRPQPNAAAHHIVA